MRPRLARVVGRTEPWARPPAHGAAMPERERQCRDWLHANGRSAHHWLAIDNQRQHVEMIHAPWREEAHQRS